MKKAFIFLPLTVFILIGMLTVSSCNKDDDKTPPVITIKGENPAKVCKGTAYVDAGASAYDDVDGDVSNTIVVTNNVVDSITGQYTVVYRAHDKSGNFIEAQRIVNVIECK